MFGHLDLLIWSYDMQGYAEIPVELLKKLKTTFEVCREMHLKIKPKKSSFSTQKIQFRGQNIDDKGYNLIPVNKKTGLICSIDR